MFINNIPEHLNNILQHIDSNKHLNALLEFFIDEAKERALAIQEKLASNTQGRLAGLMVAIKDNLCYKGHIASAGSKILENFKSPYNATAIERLLENDAIIIGRANCDEFAMGSSGEKSAFGVTLNPHDNSRVPGGSSSGSAAAVAAGMCDIALGSDTGGSVRQPASFCGVVGLKPTYGRVSRWGLIAYASSFDQIGILSNNVEDCHKTLHCIEGPDGKDSTLKNPLTPLEELRDYNKKAKVAILKPLIDYEGLNPEIRKQFNEIKEKLKNSGHLIEEIDFQYLEYIIPVFHIIAPAEASLNLARFDGVRYGHRTKKYNDIHELYEKTRAEGFGKEVKRRIIAGTYSLTENRKEEYLIQAQKVRRLMKDEVDKIFTKYDFILTPTTPDIAFKFGERNLDPVKMFLEDIYLMLANITGNPAISLPMMEVDNMPAGIQLIGKSFNEQDLLEFSNYIMGI